jgi:hypothetical protein
MAQAAGKGGFEVRLCVGMGIRVHLGATDYFSLAGKPVGLRKEGRDASQNVLNDFIWDGFQFPGMACRQVDRARLVAPDDSSSFRSCSR